MLSSLKIANLFTSSYKSLINAPRCNVFVIIQNVAGLKTRTLESRLGMPEKPKKPLTPFFRFLKEMRPKLQAQHPTTKTTDIVKLVSSQWPSYSEEQKKKWEEQYKKEHEKYLIERTKYQKTLSDDQRLELRQLKDEIEERRERQKHNKAVRQLGKPKRALTAFLIYLTEQRATQKPAESYRDWHKRTTSKWLELTEKEKEKFFQKSKENLLKYQTDLRDWEMEMAKKGHANLIRGGSLVDKPSSPLKKP